MRRLLITFIIISIFLCGCSNDSYRIEASEDTTKKIEDTDTIRENLEDIENTEETSTRPENTGSDTYVYMCGEVVNEGVYKVAATDRICDVIVAAGGLTEEADSTAINQAAKVEDGMQVYIPSIYDESGKAGAENASSDDFLVDLNTATAEELMTLTGVGESKARAIISYREEHGRFSTIEELMNIDGIKQGVYNKIKDSIKVS